MEIREYLKQDGVNPFRKWLDNLRDMKTKARIESRLTRVALGNFGDHKPIGHGVYELRLMFGPGYRIYYAKDGDNIILLLVGGDKSTQQNDIKQAQEYWSDYNA